ncbi:hypothetical protein NDU88_005797 [Pleurodeles waltl]|uniref:Uncharacterized protein n=1 Tax=Pleurodeles waltl TaxID=8319 RepID=A0AAV7L1Y4_PLEWA|nr:hypothetical protein NDU88_005797 [Pleurodeles waltl]
MSPQLRSITGLKPRPDRTVQRQGEHGNTDSAGPRLQHKLSLDIPPQTCVRCIPVTAHTWRAQADPRNPTEHSEVNFYISSATHPGLTTCATPSPALKSWTGRMPWTSEGKPASSVEGGGPEEGRRLQ